MKIEKEFRLLGTILVFIAVFLGCSNETGITPHKDNLIGRWSFRYNTNLRVIQKINSVAYDKISQSTIIAFEPVLPSQPNIINLKLSPAKEDLLNSTPKINLAQITRGAVNKISISPNGVYTAFGGRARELVLLKNNLIYKTFYLDDEITCIEFNSKNENILAVGDRGGKVTLIDTNKRSIIKTIKLFNEEITSLSFYGKHHLLAVGRGSQIFQIDSHSGKIIREIETNGFKEKVYHLTSLKPCSKPRINQILYIASSNIIITSHGWDYCNDFRIRFWDGKTMKHIRDVTIPKSKTPVSQMVWVPKFNSLVFADNNQNLWKLSIKDFSLSALGNLLHTMSRYFSMKKEKLIHTTLGNINSLISIPETPYLLLGTGSYFKGGPKVLLIELYENSFKHIANLSFGNRGLMHFAVSETLLREENLNP